MSEAKITDIKRDWLEVPADEFAYLMREAKPDTTPDGTVYYNRDRQIGNRIQLLTIGATISGKHYVNIPKGTA